MGSRYRIAMIASECVPFAKTGGLADVVGALPKALVDLGHEAIVVMPMYRSIDAARYHLVVTLPQMGVWMGDTLEWCSVYSTHVTGFPVYFIQFDRYFDRWGLYHDADFHDYLDNPRRFGFLTRAGLQLCRDLQFAPHIVHAHDWQTALAPAYLKIWHWDDPILGNTAGVLTIHNIAYQGGYPSNHYNYLGLQWNNFTNHKFEDHGSINFLKGGIYYSDLVNTVSPTYAHETLTPEGGKGLAPYLNNKGAGYVGILNGADYEHWNPATDPLIPARFSTGDLSGKAECKRELQRRLDLESSPDIPVVGVVSRFVEQKGLNLLAQVIEPIIKQMRVQFAIIGAGDKELENYYGSLPARYPGKIGAFIGYHEELSHWVEAGSDFFLMPSIFEPCGLNQMYSLKYGTLPIVRATGGLDDTVDQYDERTGSGTGFKFWEPSGQAIYYTVGWAVSTYYDRKEHIRKMMQAAMSQDFSWGRSARMYEQAYQKARAYARKTQ